MLVIIELVHVVLLKTPAIISRSSYKVEDILIP